MIFAEFLVMMTCIAFVAGSGYSLFAHFKQKQEARLTAKKAMRDALVSHQPQRIDEVLVMHGEFISKEERDLLITRQYDFEVNEEAESFDRKGQSK